MRVDIRRLFLAVSLTLLLAGISYVFHRGLRINPEVRIPGMVRLLSPFGGLWQNMDMHLQEEGKEITLQGPISAVRIYYDDRMVPHIFADNDNDALFAQGYVEAKARLWQMDFMSRLTAGRLSEVLGQGTVSNDLLMRKYALKYGAEVAVEKWSQFPVKMRKLNSYLDGVNAFMSMVKDSKLLPLEFKLANYQPEPWTKLSSALVSKYMAYTLCENHKDISMSNNRKILGEKMFNELYQLRDPKQIPVAAENSSQPYDGTKRVKPKNIEYKELLKDIFIRKAPEGIGSNNWAISSGISKTGYPILANDPHLQLSLPSIWYELHIVTPEINAHGVSVPGIPGILIGFNEDVAWGSTNVGQDVLDVYTIDWVDEQKTEYRVDGETKEAIIIPQHIKVKNGTDIKYNQIITDFGPVLYESTDPETPDMAIQWIALMEPKSSEIDIFYESLKCKDYDCYKAQTNHFFAPAQNFVFADKDGDIGIQITGNLPVKYKEEGRFVKKGNSMQNKWSDFLPRKSNPQTLNPSRGYVSSANQISVGEDYPHYFNGRFSSFRGRRINDLLGSAITKMDHRDMKDFQQDVYNIKAAELLPVFLSYVEGHDMDDKSQVILDTLLAWDYNYYADLSAPTIFEKWLSMVDDKVWDEIDNNEGIPTSKPSAWLLNLLANEKPNHEIFDVQSTTQKETLKELVLSSFITLAKELDFDKDYSWWKENNVSIEHPLKIPGYSWSSMKMNGTGDALNAVRGNFGPSWRFVVELGPEPKAWGVYPGGQSGNPLSAFYDNMIQDWADGNYYEINLNKGEEYYKENNLYIEQLNPDGK